MTPISSRVNEDSVFNVQRLSLSSTVIHASRSFDHAIVVQGGGVTAPAVVVASREPLQPMWWPRMQRRGSLSRFLPGNGSASTNREIRQRLGWWC